MVSRRVGLGASVAAALLLAPALAVAPPVAGPAAAAEDGLVQDAAATYLADPDAGVVRVTVTESATNSQPNIVRGGIVSQYYYTEIVFAIHSEAVAVAAADSRGSLRTTRAAKDGYDLETIRLRSPLFYGQTASVTLRYELPGGAPRTSSQIRVGEAFIGFYVFAWGDAGRGSVRVEMPTGFQPEVKGDQLDQGTDGGSVVLSIGSIGEPASFYAVILASRDARFSSTRIPVGDGDAIVVRAWPEDDEWMTHVTDTLRLGLPLLQDLVGLDWPVDGDLVVTEVQSAALEGYAGIYDSSKDTIAITEELDDLTTVHETSHAWFNESLFDSRWIDEGFADGYASLVLDKLRRGTYEPPTKPLLSTPGHVSLNDWSFPGRIADKETAEREDYGYNASWFVVRSLISEVGPDRMRHVLRAAAQDEIAYVGAAAPEKVTTRDGWQRFLDLLDEVGGAHDADGLFRVLVVSNAQAELLSQRSDARAAYAALTAAGDGWRPPLVVRKAMSDWRFDDAAQLIDTATAVLADRDRLVGEAETLQLSMPDLLAVAWNNATTDFVASTTAIARLDAAIDDLRTARAAIEAKRDFLTTVGLLGAKPESGWIAAAHAFVAGDLEAADATTNDVDALLLGAPEAGRNRMAGAASAGGGLLIVGFLVRRRRQRGATVAPGAATAGALRPAVESEPAIEHGPSATLPPDRVETPADVGPERPMET